MNGPKKSEKTFFQELRDLCERRLLPSAKRAWGELKQGGRDFKNVVANRKSQVQPRVREMKTKLTDAWERSEKKEKTTKTISKAAETSEEWAKRSMEKLGEKAKEWQPNVESAIEEGKKTSKQLLSKVKSKFKRKE